VDYSDAVSSLNKSFELACSHAQVWTAACARQEGLSECKFAEEIKWGAYDKAFEGSDHEPEFGTALVNVGGRVI
jgi:hypothetical protein